MSKKFAAILLSVAALSAVPAAIAPVAAGTADAVANDWARYGFPENYTVRPAALFGPRLDNADALLVTFP